MSKLTRQELVEIIYSLIEKSNDERKLAQDIANFLVQEQQTGDLDGLMRAITAKRQKAGTVEASVTTAFPLQPKVRKEVEGLIRAKYPKANKVVLNSQVEPAVLSGARIQTIDKQLDTTARGKLNQLTSNRI